MLTDEERAAFVRSQTRLLPVPFVPEIQIHTASELSPLWAMTQTSLDALELEPPYWAFPWPGGQGLARAILDGVVDVRGKRVFDFCSGSGLVAIASVLAGASRVTACDIDPFAGIALAENLRAANVELEWDARDRVGDELGDFDVVTVGDAFYEREPAARFHAWLERLSARLSIFVGDPGRAYLPSGLVELASYPVPVSLEVEGSSVRQTRVFRYPSALDGAASLG